MRNPITFHAKMMGDIMYLQQAVRQPDAKEFIQTIIKEVNGHVDCNNWTLQKYAKFLRMSKMYHLYGHYEAIAISQRTKSSHTRPGWTSTVERKPME
jgi:hypothetical protein